MPFKESFGEKKSSKDENKEQELLKKHEQGAALSGKEKGFIGKMLGEARRKGDQEKVELLQKTLKEQGNKKQEQPQKNPGSTWTHRSNPDMHTSYAVKQAERHHRHRTESKRERKQEQAVEVYLNRLEEILKEGDEEKLNTLRKLLHRAYCIREDNIPESYWENYRKRLRNEGHGEVTITEEIKREEVENIIADQQGTLDQWFDYLTSQDALYPIWTKYWAITGVASLGRYDKERKQFTKRDNETVAPFPHINREALAYITDLIAKKVQKETTENPAKRVSDKEFMAVVNTMDFGKYYAFALEHATVSNEVLFETIEGEWITYPQGSDHMPLVQAIKGHGTGWCTAGEQTAKKQLEVGEFHVYYSNDLLGEATIPRIAIRMQGNSIAEVRGVAPDQNFDPYITPVVEEKLQTFPDGDQYKQRTEDMAYLTDINRKIEEGQELSNEEIRFLYELDRKIESPGYQQDPRIQEILNERDPKQDLPQLFNCREDQISLAEEDALSGDIIYHYGNLNLNNLTSAEGLQLPEHVGGYLYLDGLTSAEGLQLPEHVGGGLDLDNLTSAEGLQLPEHVGGDLHLNRLTSAEGLQLPEHVGGHLYLGKLTSAEGLQLPEHVGGDLYLDGLTSAEKRKLQEEYPNIRIM